MEFVEIKAKTVDEAINKALIQLEITSDRLEYEVIEKGSSGFLGLINTKPAIIKAKIKETLVDKLKQFMNELFEAMGYIVSSDIEYSQEDHVMNIQLSGNHIGNLIGKRGQTLDALQHIIGLYINKISEQYIKVKVDSENYRERRKEFLVELAHRLANKAKYTRRNVELEPMNAFERRMVHSALQDDKYVYTKSYGEEPNRKVVIMLRNTGKEERKHSVKDTHSHNKK